MSHMTVKRDVTLYHPHRNDGALHLSTLCIIDTSLQNSGLSPSSSQAVDHTTVGFLYWYQTPENRGLQLTKTKSIVCHIEPNACNSSLSIRVLLFRAVVHGSSGGVLHIHTL